MDGTLESGISQAADPSAAPLDGAQATRKEALVMAERRAKAERLRARGVEPYTALFPDRSEIAAVHAAAPAAGGSAVRVAGRLLARRHHGQVVFMDLRDGSGTIQVVCLRDALGEDGYELIADVDVGDVIGVEGERAEGKDDEIVVKARALTVLGKALLVAPTRPAEQADGRAVPQELDLIAGDATREMLRARHALNRFLRAWFDARGFLEVDTPLLVPLTGGSDARPFVTRGEAVDSDLHLRISIEQDLKRLTAGGFEDVYELGRCFRNEGLSKRHHFEFTMLEWLQGYRSYHETMDLIEAVVSDAAEALYGRQRFERGGRTFDLTRPWRRITAREAILEHAGVDVMSATHAELAALAPAEDGASPDWPDLVGSIYSKLVESNLFEPTFVIDFPKELFPLGRRHPRHPQLGENFEAVVAGIELSSGTTNLNDPDEQRARFTLQQARSRRARADDGELPGMDERFLRTLAYGMMPVTGAGIGVDRVLMLLTGRETLRDVIPFPTR